MCPSSTSSLPYAVILNSLIRITLLSYLDVVLLDELAAAVRALRQLPLRVRQPDALAVQALGQCTARHLRTGGVQVGGSTWRGSVPRAVAPEAHRRTHHSFTHQQAVALLTLTRNAGQPKAPWGTRGCAHPANPSREDHSGKPINRRQPPTYPFPRQHILKEAVVRAAPLRFTHQQSEARLPHRGQHLLQRAWPRATSAVCCCSARRHATPVATCRLPHAPQHHRLGGLPWHTQLGAWPAPRQLHAKGRGGGQGPGSSPEDKTEA